MHETAQAFAGALAEERRAALRDGLVSLDTAKAHVHSASDFVRELNLQGGAH